MLLQRKSASPVVVSQTTKIGRPTSLTEPVRLAIIDAISRGLSYAAAAQAAGVNRATVYSWRKRGEAGEEPFASFLAEVTRARADGERRMADIVLAHAESREGSVSLNAAIWWLERRRPERWARRDKPELTVRTEDPKTLTREQLVARITQLAVAEGILPGQAVAGALGVGSPEDDEEDDR